MESNIIFYFAVYWVIIGIFILFILSPLSLYLSLRLFQTPDMAKKNTFLISLVLFIPCLFLLSLPDIFRWNSRIGDLIAVLLSLSYCAFLFRKMFKGSLIKSIGLSLSYGLLNTLLIFGCLFILSLISRDQTLDPEARAWLSGKPAEVTEADNLYYALIGFSAEPNENAHQAGLRCVREYNEYYQKKIIAEKQKTPLPPFPGCLSPKPPSSDKNLDALCDINKPDCLARFRTEQTQFNSLIQKYQFLIDNYMALSHYTGYNNVAIRGPESPLIQAGLILKAHKLFVARTFLNYLKGKRSESMADLQKDMTFQRQNIVRSDNFIFLMVSASLLNRDLYLYSQLLDQDISEKTFQKEVEIPLLSDKEKDLENALQGEFQSINSIFESESLGLPLVGIGQLEKFPRKLVFKPNATVNQFFSYYKSILKWSRLAADKRLSSPEINTIPSLDFLDVGYNPQGVIFLSIASPNFGPYIYRLDNLDGLIRLVKIKQRIRHDRIAKDQIETFLKRDLPYCKNPYTNQPMTWDAKNDVLYFIDPTKEGQKVAVHIPFSNK